MDFIPAECGTTCEKIVHRGPNPALETVTFPKEGSIEVECLFLVNVLVEPSPNI